MSSDSGREETDIDVILQQIGLQQYTAAFEANKISIEHVEIMTEEDFKKLGVCEMGTRLKIKQACRNFLKGNQSSAVVKQFKILSKKKKTSNARRNNPRNEKPTRRVYVGWKHMSTSGIFKVVVASKGGGQQMVDIDKNSSYTDMVKQVVERYFPDGKSKWQNLHLDKLTYFIGSYTGEPVPTMEDTGGFTVAKYFDSLKLYPVRLYLHTECIEETHAVEDKSKLQDVFEENVTHTEQTVLHTVEEELPDIPGCSTFLDADTPTVQFNANRLRLSLGPEMAKVFSHNLVALEKDQYRSIGRLVALSLAQDGPGMEFLSPDLYDAMVGKQGEIKDVNLPEDIKLMIQKLRNADNPQEIDRFLSNYCDQLLDCGIMNVYRMAREQKDELVQIIIKHQIFYRTAGEVSQFVNGMNDVRRCWEMVSANSDSFKPLFCHNNKEITGQEFIDLFKVNHSELGSNNRQSEDITIYGWESFLQSIEAREIDVTLPEVLAFITGADCIPPCGFRKKIDIDFYSDDGRLPSVSTCALQLWLPRVSDPDIIVHMMVRAIKESLGFLKI